MREPLQPAADQVADGGASLPGQIDSMFDDSISRTKPALKHDPDLTVGLRSTGDRSRYSGGPRCCADTHSA